MWIKQYARILVSKHTSVNNNKKILFRSQKKSFLDLVLSDQEKIRRRKKTTVGIQMTLLSWTLEVISGVSAFALILFISRQDTLEIIAKLLIIFNHCLYFIFIPLSYLINTEVIKAIVYAQGWLRLSKSCIPSFLQRSRQVEPEHDDNLE